MKVLEQYILILQAKNVLYLQMKCLVTPSGVMKSLSIFDNILSVFFEFYILCLFYL